MKVTTQPDFAVGYFEHGSHRLLPIEHCPISSPLVNRALQALRQSSEFQLLAAEIAEVQFFANHDDSALLLEVSTRRAIEREAFRPAWQALEAALPELRGVALFPFPGEDEPVASGAPPGFARAAPQFLGESELKYVTSEGRSRSLPAPFFRRTGSWWMSC